MSLKTLVNKAGGFIHDNSSNILTILSIIGVGGTVWTAHQDTLKAEDVIYQEKPRDTKEMVEMCWQCYIPTGITALSTIGCIIGSHYCDARRAQALSSAYILSQTTLQEYQKKVIERIGKNKERQIREEIAHDRVEKATPVLYSQGAIDALDTGHGKTLFYDVPGERYFLSDINYIKAQVNDLNYEVRSEMEFDWNELSYRWGLPFKKYGSEMIFDVDHPLEVSFLPEMMEDGRVRILLDYNLIPRGCR